MITFFDFDQEHADGAKGYAREFMFATNFEALILDNDPSLEVMFSSDMAARIRAENDLQLTSSLSFLEGSPLFQRPACSLGSNGCYDGGLIRILSFTEWDWNQDRRLALHRPRGWAPRAWPPTQKGGVLAQNDPNWRAYVSALEQMYGYTADESGSICGYRSTLGRCFPDRQPSSNPNDGPYFTSEVSPGTDFVRGVILRSTEQGTGPPKFPKAAWIGCQDECADGLTPSNAVCNMAAYTCNNNWGGPTQGFNNGGNTQCGRTDTRCGPSNSQWSYVDRNGNTVNHLSGSFSHWTGCGFRYQNSQSPFASNQPILITPEPNANYSSSAFFGYPQLCGNARSGPTNQSEVTSGSAGYPVLGGLDETPGPNPGLYDDNVACILDCPRTTVRDDCARSRRGGTNPPRLSNARALPTPAPTCACWALAQTATRQTPQHWSKQPQGTCSSASAPPRSCSATDRISLCSTALRWERTSRICGATLRPAP
jgi:hypothetical protein